MLYQLSYTPKGNDENAGRQARQRVRRIAGSRLV